MGPKSIWYGLKRWDTDEVIYKSQIHNTITKLVEFCVVNRISLSYANLADCDLAVNTTQITVWPNVRFDRSVLAGTRLTLSAFVNASFVQADLSEARFDKSTFRDCNFQSATLYKTFFIGCTFTGCLFDRARFEITRFKDCVFENCSFTDAYWLWPQRYNSPTLGPNTRSRPYLKPYGNQTPKPGRPGHPRADRVTEPNDPKRWQDILKRKEMLRRQRWEEAKSEPAKTGQHKDPEDDKK